MNKEQDSNDALKLKRKIKSLMAEKGFTLETLSNALNEKYKVNESKNNISNKMTRGSLRFIEVERIVDVLDFEICFKPKS